ncbi:MAG TPA: EAL domain-containing protein [Candidatus Limnocylindria bacterium]
MTTRTTERLSSRTRARRARPLVVSNSGATRILESALEAVLIAEQGTMRFRWANAAACALLGCTRAELLSMSVPDIHPADELPGILDDFRRTSVGGGLSRSIPVIRQDGTRRLVDISTSLIEIEGVACMVGFFTDVTEARQRDAHNHELARAVEQTSDSVVITDADGTIRYVNPAFERLSGWSREEAIGVNPRILRSGRQTDAFYRAFWRRLTRGSVWRGSLTNRRKDGALYEVQATISPLHGLDGAITGYVGVERDVTAIRAAESALAAEFRERARVAEALGRLQPGPTAEATAAEICDELLALPGFDITTVFDFAGSTLAIPLAHGGPEGPQVATGRPIPEARARYLYERASLGPWAEAWRIRPEDGAYGAAMAAIGMRAAAYAPIRNGDGLLGLIAAGTTDPEFAQHLIDHLPVVGEFAAAASALLGRWLETEHRAEVARQRIEQVIAAGTFAVVFQPIFDIVSGVPAGYEALTRFDDGSPPERMFADAHAVGLGTALEMACAMSALDEARSLGPDAWVSVNISPSAVQAAIAELGAALRHTRRVVVLELTEHAEVGDYAALRRTLDSLGPNVRLAVDDAGSGFASMRHVVELRPQFLKVDISLVRGVRRDVTRQAMIAGLVRFAQQAQCAVIAEGIERRSDLQMLRQLGVQYGQGFLLGRPRPYRSALPA